MKTNPATDFCTVGPQWVSECVWEGIIQAPVLTPPCGSCAQALASDCCHRNRQPIPGSQQQGVGSGHLEPQREQYLVLLPSLCLAYFGEPVCGHVSSQLCQIRGALRCVLMFFFTPPDVQAPLLSELKAISPSSLCFFLFPAELLSLRNFCG